MRAYGGITTRLFIVQLIICLHRGGPRIFAAEVRQNFCRPSVICKTKFIILAPSGTALKRKEKTPFTYLPRRVGFIILRPLDTYCRPENILTEKKM